ncbi:MAG: S1-like domain-containing RNA-binding protein [Spirochaetales bacterium]
MTMGTTVTLQAARQTDNGYYLTDGTTEVLLPKSEIPDDLKVGGEARVFLYRDSEDRPTATLRRPFVALGEASWLMVSDVNAVGAFVDFGLRKHLLVPPSQQLQPLVVGQKALVMMVLDEETDRLYGTTLISKHLATDLTNFRLGQEIDCQVWRLHEKGWTVLVESRWQGLVYKNEAPRALSPGERFRGYVSELRQDGKLDVRLRPQGFVAGNNDARDRIIEALTKAGGSLSLDDTSPPDEIQRVLGVSKKAFKTACGTLWKDKIIEREPGLIRLSKAASGS